MNWTKISNNLVLSNKPNFDREHKSESGPQSLLVLLLFWSNVGLERKTFDVPLWAIIWL